MSNQTSRAAVAPVDPILTGRVLGAVPDPSLLSNQGVVEELNVNRGALDGTIFVEPRRPFMGDTDHTSLARAPGADHKQLAGGDPTTTTYSVRSIFGAERSLPVEIEEASQFPIALREREASILRSAMMLNREVNLASLLFTTGNWTGTVACNALTDGGSAKWSDVAARPLAGLIQAVENYRQQNGGIMPDTLVMGYSAANALRKNDEMRGIVRIATGNGSALAAGADRPLSIPAVQAAISAELGIPAGRVFIGSARRETAATGAASSEADIWTDTCWFGNLLGGNGAAFGSVARVQAVGAMVFTRNEITGFHEEFLQSKQSLVIRANDHRQYKALVADLGYSITDCA